MGNCLFGEISFGELPAGEISAQGTILLGNLSKCLWGTILSGKLD